MFIPRVRPKARSSCHVIRQIPPFRRWIKKLFCAVKGCMNTDIDPAHVRYGLPSWALKGGTSLKPHDIWLIPLCRMHHDEQHKGEQSFAAKYKLEPVILAWTLFCEWCKATAAGQKWRRENEIPPRPTPAMPVGTSEEETRLADQSRKDSSPK